MLGNTQPFQKRILLPFWLLRFALILALIGIYSWALAYVSRLSDDDLGTPAPSRGANTRLRETQRAATGVIAPLLALLLVCAMLDVSNIVMISRRRLRPLVLAFNILQTLFWLAMLILSAVGTAAAHNAGVVVNLIMFLLYLGPLVYASYIYRRERKDSHSGRYQQAPRSDSYEAQPMDLKTHPYGHRQMRSHGGTTQMYTDLPKLGEGHDHATTQRSSHEGYADNQSGKDTAVADDRSGITPF